MQQRVGNKRDTGMKSRRNLENLAVSFVKIVNTGVINAKQPRD